MRNALRSIARLERNGRIDLTGLEPVVLVLPSLTVSLTFAIEIQQHADPAQSEQLQRA